MDEETLKEMIAEQQQAVERAQAQLEKLYDMADNLGIKVAKTSMPGIRTNSSVKNYIEKHRQEIMQRVSSVREQAMSQAQKVLDGASSGMTNFNVPKMPNIAGAMPTLPSMSANMNIEEVKAEFEKALKQHGGNIPSEVAETVRKKLDMERNDE